MFKKFCLVILFFLFIPYLIRGKQVKGRNLNNHNLQKEVFINENNFHIAFPDAKRFCKNNLITYRKGLTHASDKGKVIVNYFKENSFKNIFEISDKNFDIRNPYLFKDDNNLFIYVTKFDYTLPKRGFQSSILFQLSDGCKFLKKPKFIKEINKTVIYSPISKDIGSYGVFIKDRVWCLRIFQNQRCHIASNDEELSIIKNKNSGFFGLLRNHPRLGKELIYIEFNKLGKIISKKDWCKNHRNSTLVSPKIYKNTDKYYVAFAEREVTNNYKPIVKSRIWLKIFNSKKELENCNPHKIYKTEFLKNWDMGYPTILFIKPKPMIIWYEYLKESSNLYFSNF